MTLEQPVIKFLDNDDAVLMEDYTYQWSKGFGKKKREYRRTVFKGFIYDLASVPWIFRPIVERHGLMSGPSTMHDDGYVARGVFPYKYGVFQQKRGDEWLDVTTPMSRKLTDKLFLRMMKKAGVNFFIRQAAYRAVRLAGYIYWNT